MGTPDAPDATTGRVAAGYAAVVVWLRWPVLAAWLAAAVYVAYLLTAPTPPPDTLVSLVPDRSPGMRADALALRLFRVPLTAETEVVQRNPHGLPDATLQRVFERAARVDGHRSPDSPFSVPVTNARGVVPGSRETGTTAITYLTFPPAMTATARQAAAVRYADSVGRSGDDLVGVTGIFPAELHEGRIVDDALPLIEIATIVIVALLVGARFRAAGAPLVTLAAIGAAYSLADQLVARAARSTGLEQPSLLRPLLVALVLGIVTDYAVFYLSNARTKMLRGQSRLAAARQTTAETTPIVMAGGAILTGGLVALRVARVHVFEAIGPGLALAVVVSVGVAITLIPAALAVFGRLLFWPRMPAAAKEGAHTAATGRLRGWTARLIAHRSVALLVTLACAAGLCLAARPAAGMRLGVTTIAGLPADSQERVAAGAVAQGFQPGMLSPTQVILTKPGVAGDVARLARFQRELDGQPGIVATVGPADAPFERGHGILTSRRGGAARFLVAYGSDPYGATAVDDLQQLRGRLPGLAAAAGLDGAGVSVAGDTAVAADTVHAIRSDAARVVVAVLAVNLILLMLFLRAIVAPVLLVASSVLSVAATLGITTWTFQTLLGHHELTSYIPFAAGVLLVSLGSDYNVYVAGRVWQEARVRPLREALVVAPARTGSAIRTAGITLAAGFGVLAIVDLRAFRELAFALAVGILLETFVVRPLLAPALVSLFGEVSGWPGGRLARGRTAEVDG